MTASDRHSQLLKATAKRLGFDFCGIAKAEFLEEEAPKLEEWLRRDYQGRMGYLANHFDKRLDPRKLVEGAKTVVSLVYNYYPERAPSLRQRLLWYLHGLHGCLSNGCDRGARCS